MKLAIIHPWLPQYRVNFFERLLDELQSTNIDCQVFYGETPPEWTARNDRGASPRIESLPTKFYGLGSRTVSHKRVGTILNSQPEYSHIIVEQAVRNLETYDLLIRAALNRRTKVGMWGHGAYYTKSPSIMQTKVMNNLTRRSDWFFSYTEGGRKRLVDNGYAAGRSTVVQNSTDSSQLTLDLAAIAPRDVSNFRDSLGLTNKVGMYLGGLDEAKRVGFLLETILLALRTDADLSFLVAGGGADADLVRAAAAKEPRLVYCGPLFGEDKAVALRSASVLLVPGRVGLVAVDSLVAGVPIVTTSWPYHAPEFEYLRPNETCVVSTNNVNAYVHELLSLLGDETTLKAMSDSCKSDGSQYSTESMVGRFAEGVRGWRDAS